MCYLGKANKDKLRATCLQKDTGGWRKEEEMQGFGGWVVSVPLERKITNGWMPNQPLPLNEFYVKIRNNPKTGK